MFICATDEPGTPAELAALEEGKSVQDYCGAAERGGLRRSPSSMRHAWIANLLRVALGDRFAGESANAGGSQPPVVSLTPAISSTRSTMRRRSFGPFIRVNALVSASPSEVARKSKT